MVFPEAGAAPEVQYLDGDDDADRRQGTGTHKIIKFGLGADYVLVRRASHLLGSMLILLINYSTSASSHPCFLSENRSDFDLKDRIAQISLSHYGS